MRPARPTTLLPLLLSFCVGSAVLGAGPIADAAPPAAVDAEEEEVDPLFDEDFDFEAPGYPDPLESSNRGVLAFNQVVDRFVMEPITEAYSFVTPGPVRQAFRRVFANLDSIPTLANDLLQLEFNDAAVTLTRFYINSTFGLAGLFDPASAVDLEAHHSDFGQTLALAGTPSGPYLVFPLLGPTTARDGTGALVDAVSNPLLYFLGPLTVFHAFYAGSSSLVLREEAHLKLQALEDSSIDFYASLRSAFYQDREAQVWMRREHRRDDALQ